MDATLNRTEESLRGRAWNVSPDPPGVRLAVRVLTRIPMRTAVREARHPWTKLSLGL